MRSVSPASGIAPKLASYSNNYSKKMPVPKWGSMVGLHLSNGDAQMSLGSFASISADPRHVRFPPHSDRKADAPGCQLGADFVAEISARQSVALVGTSPVSARSIEGGGFDAFDTDDRTAMSHRQRLRAAVGLPAWRAGVGSVQ